jgi:cobalt-zinc-cadmium efflux system outer membrane protein
MQQHRQTLWNGVRLGLLLTGLGGAGCAQVNPAPDFEQVRARVRNATGHSNVYRPDENALVEERVRVLREEGLTRDEAVQVCLLNNPRFQAAAMAVGMARADLVQSGLLSNPTLGVSMRLPSGGGLANLDVGLAQNIAELWQLPARQNAAQAELDAAILELAHTAAHLATQTQAAYFAAIGADALHAVAVENCDVVRLATEAARMRRETGAGSDLDVNLAQAQLLDAELAVALARLAAADARRELAVQLGITDDARTLVLVDPLPERPAPLSDGEVLVARARAHRLDLRAAEHESKRAAAQYALEMRRVLPTVEAGAAFERDERRAGDGSSGRPFIVGPSLGLELPLFDQNQAQIARAEFAWRQVEKRREAIDREMVQEVRSAADHAAAAWKVHRICAEESVPLAERNLALAREAYNAGGTSFLAVLEAQRFFLQARTRAIESHMRAAQTLPALERAVGTPISEGRMQCNDM